MVRGRDQSPPKGKSLFRVGAQKPHQQWKRDGGADSFFKMYLFLVFTGLGLHYCMGLLQLQRAGATLQLWCADFSLRQLFLLLSMGSRTWAQYSGAWAQLPKGMRNLPGPAVEFRSLVLADVFFTTEPPGKSCPCCCSVAKSCPTLRPHGLQHTIPVLHYLVEFSQTPVH